MRIPDETVERIKQAADILEVVGDFVSLKRRGSNYIACCPFHNEKSPSFNVNPARQIYKCFGCGKAGDPVRFVMDIENLAYGEALRYLAKKYNIEIAEQEVTPEEQQRHTERESLYIVLNYAKDFFARHLLQTDEGRGIGLSYFRERGFSDPTIAAFDLGYSPDLWDALLTEAQAKGYNPALLAKAGLTITREESGKIFDRFRARVMFPIHNVSGRVIAFGARILKPDPKAPKYLNSPETEAYHKSQVLYGIFQAKQAIRQEDVCYLTEGYTDVISLHQAGIKNVVASSGTSLTTEQIRLIGRFTQNVTILYDGDAAGVKAALRGLDMVLEEGLNVSVATFPNGDDPDSYVRKVGTEAFKAYLTTNTQDFIAFKTATLLRDAGENPFKRAEVITEIVGSISRIADPIKRQVFFQTTARQLNVDEQTLITESNRLIRKQRDSQTKEQERQQERAARIDTRTDARLGTPPPPPSNVPDQPYSEGPPPAGDVPDEFFHDLLRGAGITPATGATTGEKNTPAHQRTSSDLFSPILHQEAECIRLLLTYGERELEKDYTLCRYLLSELSNTEFKFYPYTEFMRIIRKNYEDGRILTINNFIGTELGDLLLDKFVENNEIIRKEAISLTMKQYELSEAWKSKYNIFVPTEDDISVLSNSAFGTVLHLKKEVFEEELYQLTSLIRRSKDDEEINNLMIRQMDVRRVHKEISNMLGSVTNRQI